MASLSYRISRFGTLALTAEQSNAVVLSLRVISRVRRAVSYRNFSWLPPRELWLRVVGLDSLGSVCWDWEAHWPSQSTAIYSTPDIQTGVNICKASQTIYTEIMTELAKKPNIPPLPPSLPPAGRFFATPVGAPIDLRYLLFKAIDDGDFDVVLSWTPRPSGSDCEPNPLPPEPLPPLSDFLPAPVNAGGAPPPLSSFEVPSLPSGSPSIGGTSLVPPGFPPGYQATAPTPGFVKVNVNTSLYSGCRPNGNPSSVWDDVRLFPIASVAGDPLTGWTAETFGSGQFAGTFAGFRIRKNGVVVFTQSNPATRSAGNVRATIVPANFPPPTRPENITSDQCNFWS